MPGPLWHFVSPSRSHAGVKVVVFPLARYFRFSPPAKNGRGSRTFSPSLLAPRLSILAPGFCRSTGYIRTRASALIYAAGRFTCPDRPPHSSLDDWSLASRHHFYFVLFRRARIDTRGYSPEAPAATLILEIFMIFLAQREPLKRTGGD